MKNFCEWNKLKGYIEENNKPMLFREREIWWCSVGLNIGTEQDGKTEYFHMIYHQNKSDPFRGPRVPNGNCAHIITRLKL